MEKKKILSPVICTTLVATNYWLGARQQEPTRKNSTTDEIRETVFIYFLFSLVGGRGGGTNPENKIWFVVLRVLQQRARFFTGVKSGGRVVGTRKVVKGKTGCHSVLLSAVEHTKVARWGSSVQGRVPSTSSSLFLPLFLSVSLNECLLARVDRSTSSTRLRVFLRRYRIKRATKQSPVLEDDVQYL